MGKTKLTMYFYGSETLEQDDEQIPIELKMKTLKIHRHCDKKKMTRKRSHKYSEKYASKVEHSDKSNGIITMYTFLSKFLGIEGEALEQLKKCTHKELDMMQFEEVKRVPFEVVKGNSEFFWVVDSHGEKLPYENPLEKLSTLINHEGKKIPYHNLSSEKISIDDFEPEYEEIFEFIDDEEEEIDQNQCNKQKRKRRKL